MKCPSCGYENREDAQYCNLCQTSFVKPRLKPRPLLRRIPATSNSNTSVSRSFFRITPLHLVCTVIILAAVILLTTNNVFSDDLSTVDCLAVDSDTFKWEILDSPVPVLVVFCSEIDWNRVKSEYMPEYRCRAEPAPVVMAIRGIIKDGEYENRIKICKYYSLSGKDPITVEYDIQLLPTTFLFQDGSVSMRFDGTGCTTTESREKIEAALSEVLDEDIIY